MQNQSMGQTFSAKDQLQYNKIKQFSKYTFDYTKRIYWACSQKYIYYEGRQIANPTHRVFLQVLEKSYEAQLIKKNFEEELKNMKRLNPNEHTQIILEIEIYILDQTFNKRILKPCLVIKINEIYDRCFNESQKNSQIYNTIFLGKYQFHLKDKLQVGNSLGQTYSGFQTKKPMNMVFIQVLSKPYEYVTEDETKKLIGQIEDVVTISQKWAIGHFDGGKATVPCESLKEWTKKNYMIIQLIEDSSFPKQSLLTQIDFDQIHDIIKENGVIKICDGKYQFSWQDYFARGGQGHVYLGHQTNNPNNKVAIKVISSRFQEFSERKTKKLQNQLNIMKHLNPEYVVRLLDEGQTQIIDNFYIQKKSTKIKYFVMQLMDGSLEKLYRQKLQSKLRQDKKEGIRLVLYYYYRILRAYSACYQNNVVHKDLKPQNILVKINKQVQCGYQIKIADFGLSIHQTTTPIKQISGTPAYSSPQQCCDAFYTNKCDIYAFGGILIYLILGNNPVALKIIVQRKLNQKKLFQLLKSYEQDKQISNFIIKCLAYQQKDRYQYDQVLANQIFNKVEDEKQYYKKQQMLVEILIKKGSYYKALKYLLNALQTNIKIEKIEYKGSIDTAKTLNNIGSVYINLGDYNNALEKFEQCLKIQQNIKGKGSIDTAKTLNNIGSVYMNLGDYNYALEKFEQCLKIQQNIKGKGSIDTAMTLNNIGSVYMNLGDYNYAIEKYEQCLEIQQKIQGKASKDTFRTLSKIQQIKQILVLTSPERLTAKNIKVYNKQISQYQQYYFKQYCNLIEQKTQQQLQKLAIKMSLDSMNQQTNLKLAIQMSIDYMNQEELFKLATQMSVDGMNQQELYQLAIQMSLAEISGPHNCESENNKKQQ